MQTPKPEKLTSSAPPLPCPQDDIDRNTVSTSLIPLAGYHDKVYIAAQALPVQTVVMKEIPLPAELIGIIQKLCSFRDLLALTSVNKAAFALRFNNLPSQHLHFKNIAEVEQFLSYCRDAQGNLNPKDKQRSNSGLISAVLQYFARPRQSVFSLEHLQGVKTLSLTLPSQLTAKQHEQYEQLFAYLPSVNRLNISLSTKQRAASLAPLITAAQSLTLLHLSIDMPQYHIGPEDYLPRELWNLVTLETLEIKNLRSVNAISEEIGQLKALKSLGLANLPIKNLPAGIWQLDKLEELTLSGLENGVALEKIDQLKALKSLRLEWSPIKVLPAALWRLDKLEELTLFGLKLKVIPEEIGQLKALKSLKLNYLPIRALSAGLWQLDKLETLALMELFDLENEEVALREIGQLTALKSLHLKWLQSLETLPASLAELENLQEIHISSMPKLHIPQALERYIKRT